MRLIKKLGGVIHNWHILRDMSLSQLKAKYAGSALGLWWAVVTPLIIAASINFVFNLISRTVINNYTVYVLSGIIPWFFSVNALSESTGALSNNARIIRQTVFPREILSLSCVAANFFNFLIGMLILLPLFMVVNMKVIVFLPLLLFVAILHFIFICGLGILFSCLNVYFKDLSHFLATAFMGWFWLTPVFYSASVFVYPFNLICTFNPMYYYTMMYQDILYRAMMPSVGVIVISTGLSVATFILGYQYFINSEAHLLKRI